MRAYSRSKLANVLYARSLAAELAPFGVTVNAVHPGSVATDIWSRAPWYAQPFLAVAKRRMLSPEDGGRALTYLAVSPDVEGVTGEYFDRFEPRSPSELAQDDELGLRLREESARLVGLPVS
jgi:NAD(P)-dependent dehydrogenase (short-subunit alcohol dehydrogenase family)